MVPPYFYFYLGILSHGKLKKIFEIMLLDAKPMYSPCHMYRLMSDNQLLGSESLEKILYISFFVLYLAKNSPFHASQLFTVTK